MAGMLAITCFSKLYLLHRVTSIIIHIHEEPCTTRTRTSVHRCVPPGIKLYQQSRGLLFHFATFSFWRHTFLNFSFCILMFFVEVYPLKTLALYIYTHTYIYIHTHISAYIHIHIYICINICFLTSSTAQGGGGSFKNRKPIGRVGCSSSSSSNSSSSSSSSSSSGCCSSGCCSSCSVISVA